MLCCTYACVLQFVDEAKPLVSKRQPKQKKDESSQGDRSKPGTQHENPDSKEETEKEGGSSNGAMGTGMGAGGGGEEKSGTTPTPSQPAEPPQIPPKDNTSDSVGELSTLNTNNTTLLLTYCVC